MRFFRFLLMLLLPLTASCCLALGFALPASAEESSARDVADNIDTSLKNMAPDGTADYLEEHRISVSDPDGIAKLSPSDILSDLRGQFSLSFLSQRALLGRIIAAAILCAVASSLASDSRFGVIVDNTAVLFIATAVYASLSACLTLCRTTLDTLTAFMLSYLPVCSSVSAASGNAASGGSFYTSTIFLCQLIAIIVDKLLFPAVSVLIALSVAGAADSTLNLGAAAGTAKRIVTVAMSAFMMIFTGYMAVTGSVAAAADTMRARGIRFAASSFIPVIGGAVSESYGTVKQSLSVIRTSVGAVGIVLIAAAVLPPLISMLAVRLTLSLGRLGCEVLGQRRSAALLESLGSVLSLMIGVLVCFSMMFVIATGCMLAFTVKT